MADVPLRVIDKTGEDIAFLQTTVAGHTDECVVWPFRLNSYGYGRIQWEGEDQGAHRVSLALYEGLDSFPDSDVMACHSCHNRPCINPRHLKWSDAKGNSADMVMAGRSLRGDRNPTARLTDADVLAIRSDGRSHQCLAEIYGVSPSAIRAVIRRVNWAWLD